LADVSFFAEGDLPRLVRVSAGSAVVLGLLEQKLDAEPTTAYLMTYNVNKCLANCGFCPQARNSHSKVELLSRVSWPTFPTKSVLAGIEEAVNRGKIVRVCIQALNYPKVFSHLIALVGAIRQTVSVAVSVSCQPMTVENIRRLAVAGAERIGIALDAATPRLFDEVKGSVAGGPYGWDGQFRLLREAVGVFGRGNVSTHLIVGLGETEREAASLVQACVDMGVLPGLFAFTPVRGTALEKKRQPSVSSYRRVQVARYLIVKGIANGADMRFDAEGKVICFGVGEEILKRVVEGGEPFLTSGCSGCNRPFYNEKPSGPVYNYPRRIRVEEIEQIKRDLRL
jgi:biotin synthase